MARTTLRPRGLPCGVGAAVLSAALAVGLSPAEAWAAFTRTASASLTASTYTIPAPAQGSVSASYLCTNNGKDATATVIGTANVNRATGYVITLTAPDGTSSSTTTTSLLQTAVLSASSRSAAGRTFTLTVRARMGTWTGAPLTLTHTC